MVPLDAQCYVLYHTKNPRSEVSGDFFGKGLSTGGFMAVKECFLRHSKTPVLCDKPPCTQAFAKKVPGNLWTGIFTMINYITLRYQWYQTQLDINLFPCWPFFMPFPSDYKVNWRSYVPNFAATDYVFWDFLFFLKKHEFWRRGWSLEISRGRLATPSTRFLWRTLSQMHAFADARFRRRTLSPTLAFADAHFRPHLWSLSRSWRLFQKGLQIYVTHFFLIHIWCSDHKAEGSCWKYQFAEAPRLFPCLRASES